LEIVDDVLLLVDSAGDRHDEELHGVWKRRYTGRAYQRLSAVNAAI
jgi:hypothetical protein